MKKTFSLFVLAVLLMAGGQVFAQNHEYVNLGLPRGTLWATCNVGADKPEDYGDYFAWGEIATKSVYDWKTYNYCNGGFDHLTKYHVDSKLDSMFGLSMGVKDGLTTLQLEDDAAMANWGSGWCTPTKEQWEELKQNTTNTCTTRNSVNGRLFTASNGNSLFLPAAGDRWDTELGDVGSNDCYWSSSLHTDYPDKAWNFGFDSDEYFIESSSRCNGYAVRPVRSSH